MERWNSICNFRKNILYLLLILAFSGSYGCTGKDLSFEDVAITLTSEYVSYFSGETITCVAKILDPLNMEFSYGWYVDGELMEGETEMDFSFKPAPLEDRNYEIRFVAINKIYGKIEKSFTLEVWAERANALFEKNDRALAKLDNYFSNNQGAPPNAIKRSQVNFEDLTALYNYFEDYPGNLRNGGAATSSDQVSFFNYLALRGIHSSNSIPPREVYRYMSYYMMPGDGIGTRELPDSLLVPVDETERLIHWLVQVSPVNREGRPVSGDKVLPSENIAYKIFEIGFEDMITPSIPLGSDGIPDLNRVWPGEENNYKFSSNMFADQIIFEGYITEIFKGNIYHNELLRTKETLKKCLTREDSSRPYLMKFGRIWGSVLSSRHSWIRDINSAFVPYQLPHMWYVFNEPHAASRMILFIRDAQKSCYSVYKTQGPFMTGFDYSRDEFVWESGQMEPLAMTFQYQIYRNLALYYYLTKDQKALEMVKLFTAFVDENTKVIDSRRYLPDFLFINIEHNNLEVRHLSTRGNIRVIPENWALYMEASLFMYLASRDSYYKNFILELLPVLLERQQEDGSFPFKGLRPGRSQTAVGKFLMYMKMVRARTFVPYFDFFKTHILPFFHTDLKKIVEKESVPLQIGSLSEALLGNNKFFLTSTQLTTYNGLKLNYNTGDDSVTILWNGMDWQGWNHKYDGSSWNGRPVDISKYTGLYVIISMISGDVRDLKFDMNGRPIMEFGTFKEGINFIDLDKLRNAYLGELDLLKELNFVTMKKTRGSLNMKIFIE